jgi:transketolase
VKKSKGEKFMISEQEKQRLERMSKRLRYDIVKMIGVGMGGHVGGSLSAADLIAALYFHKMRYGTPDFSWENRDRFVMSKGHSVPAQYAALAEAGLLDFAEFDNFKCIGACLQGHPDHKKTPGIEANTGSLGQGLSIACGMAIALKIDKKPSRVYVMMGDGEVAEGQIWEAAMAADNFHLDNLTAILDINGLGSTGYIDKRFKMSRMKEKWEAFGWHTIELNGHDMGQICDALDEAESTKGKPSILLAKTVKGKGIPFAENSTNYHNAAFTQEQYDEVIGLFCN